MSGRGRQTAWATGSLGIGSSGSMRSICVEHEPEAVAEVGEADDDAGRGVGGEHEAHRVLAAADAQRVDLEARHGSTVIDGQTSSMCAPRTFGSPGPKWYV